MSWHVPTWKDRLTYEYEQMQGRIDNLQAFVLGERFKTLPEEDQSDLTEQLVHMRRYFAVLSSRTARHCTP